MMKVVKRMNPRRWPIIIEKKPKGHQCPVHTFFHIYYLSVRDNLKFPDFRVPKEIDVS